MQKLLIDREFHHERKTLHSNIYSLPTEVEYEILTNLDWKTFWNYRLVCRQYKIIHEVAKHRRLWYSRVLCRLKNLLNERTDSTTDESKNETWMNFLDVFKAPDYDIFLSGSTVLWALTAEECNWKPNDIDIIAIPKNHTIFDQTDIQKNFPNFEVMNESQSSNGDYFSVHFLWSQHRKNRQTLREVTSYKHKKNTNIVVSIAFVLPSLGKNHLVPVHTALEEHLSRFDFDYLKNTWSNQSLVVRYASNVAEKTSVNHLANVVKTYGKYCKSEDGFSIELDPIISACVQREKKYTDRGYKIKNDNPSFTITSRNSIDEIKGSKNDVEKSSEDFSKEDEKQWLHIKSLFNELGSSHNRKKKKLKRRSNNFRSNETEKKKK
jgi:hypothetical protein